MKNKKVIIITIIVLILIFLTIFLVYYYKSVKNGNNIINKSEEQLIEDILNIKAYNAKLDITIETNKNTTKYVVIQKVENQKCTQEVLEPENIAGLMTEYDGKNLKIRNNKLNLETTFEYYQYIVENKMWLDSFIKEFKESNKTKVNNTENEIILEINNTENLYTTCKKLYIDKKTGKPTKMQIEDINKKMLVYILYNEISIS